MAYYKKVVKSGNVIEIEKYQRSSKKTGQIIPRAIKEKPTPEQMAVINEINAEKKLRRLINTNFKPDDIYATLTYQQGYRPPPETAKKHLDSFMKSCRAESKKQGHTLKYITVTEYQKKAIHHHIIMQGISSEAISRLWNKSKGHGHVNIKHLDSTGQYKKLAQYLIKETAQSFRDKTAPYGKRWNASKNLKKPDIKVKKINSKQWRKTPAVPGGYLLEADSFEIGANPVTGLEWQKYTIIKIPVQQKKQSSSKKRAALPNASTGRA